MVRLLCSLHAYTNIHTCTHTHTRTPTHTHTHRDTHTLAHTQTPERELTGHHHHHAWLIMSINKANHLWQLLACSFGTQGPEMPGSHAAARVHPPPPPPTPPTPHRPRSTG